MQFTKENILKALMYPGFMIYPTQLEEVEVIGEDEVYPYNVIKKLISTSGPNVVMKSQFDKEAVEVDAYSFADELSKLPLKRITSKTVDLKDDASSVKGMRVSFYI